MIHLHDVLMCNTCTVSTQLTDSRLVLQMKRSLLQLDRSSIQKACSC